MSSECAAAASGCTCWHPCVVPHPMAHTAGDCTRRRPSARCSQAWPQVGVIIPCHHVSVHLLLHMMVHAGVCWRLVCAKPWLAAVTTGRARLLTSPLWCLEGVAVSLVAVLCTPHGSCMLVSYS